MKRWYITSRFSFQTTLQHQPYFQIYKPTDRQRCDPIHLNSKAIACNYNSVKTCFIAPVVRLRTTSEPAKQDQDHTHLKNPDGDEEREQQLILLEEAPAHVGVDVISEEIVELL